MIAIIGAGISGLASALTLQKLGHNIILIDKGRSVGGRLATRYFETKGVRRYIDTASHYIELSEDTPRFTRLLLEYGQGAPAQGRIFGRCGINTIPKLLVGGLQDAQIFTSCKAQDIEFDVSSRSFIIDATAMDQDHRFDVEGVVITAPVPQSIDLLARFPQMQGLLSQAPLYHKCLLLLLWPKQSIDTKQMKTPESIDRIVLQTHIAANQEPMPIAIHATYAWSDKHYYLSDEQIQELLIKETGIHPNDYDKIQVKRWVRKSRTTETKLTRQGQAQPVEPNRKSTTGYEMHERIPLVVCSDALGIGDIHHAGEAGIIAAQELSARLSEAKYKM